jgi:hypothetical protein
VNRFFMAGTPGFLSAMYHFFITQNGPGNGGHNRLDL